MAFTDTGSSRSIGIVLLGNGTDPRGLVNEPPCRVSGS